MLPGGYHYAGLTGQSHDSISSLPALSLQAVSTCYKHPDFGAHADCTAPSWQSLGCFAWIARTQAPGLGGGVKQRTAFSSDLALAHCANGNAGRSSSQGPILHTRGCAWKLEATRFLFEYISSLRTKARDEKLLVSFVRMGMPSDKLGHMSNLDAWALFQIVSIGLGRTWESVCN